MIESWSENEMRIIFAESGFYQPGSRVDLIRYE